MKAKYLPVLALLALPMLALAQHHARESGREVLDRVDGGFAAPQMAKPIAARGAATTPVRIGRMWNALSAQSAYTNLLYYDPFSNLAAVVHRTDRTGAGSGRIVYQTSKDGGLNWTPQIGPVNASNFNSGRHPNLLISNPTQAKDPLATSVVVTYNEVTSGAFGDVLYVADRLSTPGAPVFFGHDMNDAFSYAGAVDLNKGDCYFSIVSANAEFLAVSKLTNSGTSLSPRVVLAPAEEINLGSGTSIDVGLDGTVHWVGRAQWRKSAGAPDEDTFYWRYQRSADGGATWSAPEYVGPQVLGRNASHYEFDMIVDANNEVHIAALLVDTLVTTGSGVALYDLVRSTSGTWSGTKVEDIRVPQFIPPAYAPGGIGDLNAPELAKTKDGTNLALKWIDIVPNPVTSADSTIQDVWISYKEISSSWSVPQNVSNSPGVYEIFTNLAPLMSDQGRLFMFYITPSLSTGDENSEHDIWFLPGVTIPVGKVSTDVGVTSIQAPNVAALGSVIQVSLTIRNFGTDAQSNFPVSYQLNAETPVTENFTGTLQPNTAATLTFATPWRPTVLGTYTITGRTGKVGDERPGNDVLTKTVQVVAHANDVGISGFILPNQIGRGAPTTIRVRITNFGSSVQSNFPVSYQINTDTPVTENYPGTLAPLQTATMTFSTPWRPAAAGTYQIAARTNLNGDQNTGNDAAQKTVPVSQFLYAGNWKGNTSQSRPILFMVNAADEVESLTFDLEITFIVFPSLSCVYKLQSTKRVPIQNGAFEVPVTSSGAGVSYSTTVRGTFSSPTSCTGTVASFTAGGGFCDGQLIFGNIGVSEKTWNATGIPLAVDDANLNKPPERFTLSQNYPNPFNPGTTIEYTLLKAAHVELKVYDTLGQEVQTLVNSKQEAGTHRAQFGSNGLPGGVYFYRLRAGERVEVKKMVVVR